MATTKKLARSKSTNQNPQPSSINVNKQSIYRLLSEAIDGIVDEADSLRGVAESLRNSGSLSTNGDPFELRGAAGVVRCHAMGMLLSVVQIAAKAEKIMAVADLSASAGGAQ
jgi:hypothetical protein